jgi:hypothetical protein
VRIFALYRCRYNVASAWLAKEREGRQWAISVFAGDYYMYLGPRFLFWTAPILEVPFCRCAIFLTPLDLAVLVDSNSSFE